MKHFGIKLYGMKPRSNTSTSFKINVFDGKSLKPRITAKSFVHDQNILVYRLLKWNYESIIYIFDLKYYNSMTMNFF